MFLKKMVGAHNSLTIIILTHDNIFVIAVVIMLTNNKLLLLIMNYHNSDYLYCLVHCNNDLILCFPVFSTLDGFFVHINYMYTLKSYISSFYHKQRKSEVFSGLQSSKRGQFDSSLRCTYLDIIIILFCNLLYMSFN